MAAEGRVFVGDYPAGAAFLVAPGVALTARHVIKTALDGNDRHRDGSAVTVDFGAGSVWTATVDKCDPVMDVAVLRGAAAESAGVYGCGAPVQGAGWRVSTRFLPNDPVLTGTVTDPARTMRNAQGHEVELAQLHVDQDLGGFNGYSGSPVWVTGTEQGDRVAIGVLVEQTMMRGKKGPGQGRGVAANVLWAAPAPAVMASLGLAETPLVPTEQRASVEQQRPRVAPNADSPRGGLAGHAFISYVREDSNQVDQLEMDLVADGIEVWRDVRKIWPGDDWKRVIRQAIEHDSCAFIVCFSENSRARGTTYQWEEIILAAESFRLRPPGKSWIYPVRLDTGPVIDFDLGAGRRLTDLQYTDLFGSHRAANVRRLVGAIRRSLEKGR